MAHGLERRFRRHLSWVIIVLGLSAGYVMSPSAAPHSPRNDLLGLRLGMSDLEVRRRLERIGKLTEMQPEGGGRKQIWTLRNRSFGTLNLRLDPNHDLQWCTAYARTRKVRYTDIGDTTQARRAGRHIWIWAVTGSSATGSYQVTARGTDPVFCSSVALSPLTARPPGSEPAATPADSVR